MKIAVTLKGQRRLYEPKDFRERWPEITFVGERLFHAWRWLEFYRSATGPGHYVRSPWGIATLEEAIDLGWLVPADCVSPVEDSAPKAKP